jgi:heme exporter protein A
MSSPASRLVVEGVGKDFGYHHVLRDVNFTVEEGEFIALMGSNGAGKTTLLRMIAGLSRPTSGSVSIAGVDLRRAGPGLRRRIGFVSHESLLYPELTGRENLEFHARLFGVENVAAAIESLDGLLELAPILDRQAGVLSRGNRQRLTLARALLHAPRVLLLDEPFTGLDEASSNRLLHILQTLVDSGRTVIMTTHDRAILEAGPRRLVRIEGGTLHEDRVLTPVDRAREVVDYTPAFLTPTLAMPPKLLAAATVIARKDLRIEARTRDIVGSAGLFAICVLITMSFTSPPGETASGMATGVLWISLLFATLLGVGRTMGREQADRGIEGLLLAPTPKSAIFLGKAIASLVLMAFVSIVIVVMFIIFMAGNANINLPALLGVLAIGTTGLVIVSTLFSGIAVGTRLGESMLQLLVMPVVIPLMVGSVELTRQTLGGEVGGIGTWLAILGGFDLVMLLAALATFVFVIEE